MGSIDVKLRPEDLEKTAEKLRPLTGLRQGSEGNKETGRMHVMICAGTGCVSNKSLLVRDALEEELEKRDLTEEIQVVTTGCQGFCAQGPLAVILPDGILYQLLSVEDIPELVEQHLLNSQPVERLMYAPEKGADVIPRIQDIEFFKNQQLVALANRFIIDPENIDEYIGLGGYSALAKALTEMTSEQIVQEIKASGLRGRGGAGFPTGMKWDFCRKAPGEVKYLICNSDEGDPGAFMDRSVVESDPHAVVEGMCIGARAIGATEGFIYIREEYPLALKRMIKAIEDARERGLLGEDILGFDFSFDVSVYRGAGAFVCGEETALIASLEGKRGMPRPRPPFPANEGFRGKPTNINNVETLATVRHIIGRGAEWFSSIGTDTSAGTKIFALAGNVNHTGLVEVPMGISLREIVFDVGGGVPDNREFKAAQIGGPSGGCLSVEHLDLPIDYESVKEVGAIMGSGGLVIMDDRTCMVDIARFFQEFTQKESCGKCVPCRVGTRHLADILTRICGGEGRPGDIRELERLAGDVKSGSLCGLGQTAPNPVLSTLAYFREEYEVHVKEKRCPAGVCKALITYRIEADLCIACGKCRRSCPEQVITGEKKVPHVIDPIGCIRCGICQDVCPTDAVKVS